MIKYAKISAYILIALLSGCVNFMSMKGTATRDITIGDVEKIKPGVGEKQVISILGSPQSFGIDDEGREYLHYEAGQLSRVEESAILPFAGVVSTSSEIVGFVVNFYLVDGIVQGKSQYFYRAAVDKKKANVNQDAKK
jgi:hypothetical protein